MGFMGMVTGNRSNHVEDKWKGFDVYWAKRKEKLRMTCL